MNAALEGKLALERNHSMPKSSQPVYPMVSGWTEPSKPITVVTPDPPNHQNLLAKLLFSSQSDTGWEMLVFCKNSDQENLPFCREDGASQDDAETENQCNNCLTHSQTDGTPQRCSEEGIISSETSISIESPDNGSVFDTIPGSYSLHRCLSADQPIDLESKKFISALPQFTDVSEPSGLKVSEINNGSGELNQSKDLINPDIVHNSLRIQNDHTCPDQEAKKSDKKLMCSEETSIPCLYTDERDQTPAKYVIPERDSTLSATDNAQPLTETKVNSCFLTAHQQSIEKKPHLEAAILHPIDTTVSDERAVELSPNEGSVIMLRNSASHDPESNKDNLTGDDLCLRSASISHSEGAENLPNQTFPEFLRPPLDPIKGEARELESEETLAEDSPTASLSAAESPECNIQSIMEDESVLPKEPGACTEDLASREELDLALDSTHPVYAISSFWDEMEKLTINDILHLRLVGNAWNPSELPHMQDTTVADVSDAADSGYFAHPDDSKTERWTGDTSLFSDFEDEFQQNPSASAIPSPEPQDEKSPVLWSREPCGVCWESDPASMGSGIEAGAKMECPSEDTISQHPFLDRTQSFKTLCKAATAQNLPTLEEEEQPSMSLPVTVGGADESSMLSILQQKPVETCSFALLEHGNDAISSPLPLLSGKASPETHVMTFPEISKHFIGEDEAETRLSDRASPTAYSPPETSLSGRASPTVYFLCETSLSGRSSPTVYSLCENSLSGKTSPIVDSLPEISLSGRASPTAYSLCETSLSGKAIPTAYSLCENSLSGKASPIVVSLHETSLSDRASPIVVSLPETSLSGRVSPTAYSLPETSLSGKASPTAYSLPGTGLSDRTSPVVVSLCETSLSDRASPTAYSFPETGLSDRTSPTAYSLPETSLSDRCSPIVVSLCETSLSDRASPIVVSLCETSLSGRASPTAYSLCETSLSGKASPVVVSLPETSLSGRASPTAYSLCETRLSGRASPIVVSLPETSLSGKASPTAYSPCETRLSGRASPIVVSLPETSLSGRASPTAYSLCETSLSDRASPIVVPLLETSLSGRISPTAYSLCETRLSGRASPIVVSLPETSLSGRASPTAYSLCETRLSGRASPIVVSLPETITGMSGRASPIVCSLSEIRLSDRASPIVSFCDRAPIDLSLSETYDYFFSDFEVGNIFFPSIQSLNADTGIPIFSCSRSGKPVFRFAEEHDFVFPEVSPVEYEDEDRHTPIQVVTCFDDQGREPLDALVVPDAYEHVSVDKDWQGSLFGRNVLSLQRLRFTGELYSARDRSTSWAFAATAWRERPSLFSTTDPGNPVDDRGRSHSHPNLYLENQLCNEFLEQRDTGVQAVVSFPKKGFLFTLRQSDICLVCIAFASWVLKSANPQSADTWKTALLANVSAISAIQYLRRYVREDASENKR